MKTKTKHNDQMMPENPREETMMRLLHKVVDAMEGIECERGTGDVMRYMDIRDFRHAQTLIERFRNERGLS